MESADMDWPPPPPNNESAAEPMFVTAPTTASDPVIAAAHVPSLKPSPAPEARPAGAINGAGTNGKTHDDSNEDDNTPLARKLNGAKRGVGGGSSSEDEKPLAKKPRASVVAAKKRRVLESDSEESEAGPSRSPEPKAKKEVTQARTNGKAPASDSDVSDDEVPLSQKVDRAANLKPAAKKASGKKAADSEDDTEEESEDADFSDSEDEKPLAKQKAAPRKSTASAASGKGPKKPQQKKAPSYSESSEDEKPLAKKGRKSVNEANGGTPAAAGQGKAKQEAKVLVKREEGEAKKGKKVKQEDDDDDKYKWWEDEAMGDGSVKWQNFQHMGVLFPPPYIPLPKGVKMKYEGQSLTLPPGSEEVAGFFGAMLETDHAQDAVFRANFFRDFKEMLEKYPPAENVQVTSLDKCDFRPLLEHFEKEKEKKKAMTKDEKKALKEAKDKLEAPYLFAMVDERKEKVGNFRAEPPGLFRGRGEHPRKGTLKHRLRPDDIVLNIGVDAPIPKPNIPGEWKGVQHDNTVTWLAHWKENVNGQAKYVFLSAGSSWKGQSDRAKFEKARELIKHVDKIRKDYTEELKSKIMADRQRATALYFIDRLALRAGNEKGEDEAETYGCCSLKYEHVTLEPPNKVIFDFLGKDSMRFHQEVEVDQQVFKNIKIFKADPKQVGDDLFDRLTTTLLNKYLNDQMKGLTAKVFRTYNASWTFQNQLRKLTPKTGTVQEKIAAYNTANRDVAILCNHQKTVSKGFADSFAKMGDKVRALKYQRMKLRYQLFTLEPKLKKKRPDLADDESDMDEEFMERHEADLLEKAQEAAKKKFERENVKLQENKESKKPKSDLDARLKEIKEEFKELKKERKTKKVEPKKAATEEKLLEQITKMDERIAAAKVQMEDRDKTKDVALGTSKINYIDPRLTVAWARKNDVPIEKMFSKTVSSVLALHHTI